MGFLLCLVLGRSQGTLLLWKKLLWFIERLGSSWNQHKLFVSQCVTLSFLQAWLGVTAAPLVPSSTPAQRNWVSTVHMGNVTWCQLVFPGICAVNNSPEIQFLTISCWSLKSCILLVAGEYPCWAPRESGQVWAHLPGACSGCVPGVAMRSGYQPACSSVICTWPWW